MSAIHVLKNAGVLAIASLVLAGCDGPSGAQDAPASRRAAVSGDGITITFPPGSPGLGELRADTARKGTVMISVLAPARVVASVVSLPGDTGKSVVFDSPDVTSLYSQYQQSIVNVDRTNRNLSRTREMYSNQGATAKELNDAENDAAVARASLSEMQGKLIALGFDPREIGAQPPKTIWLISDVPENELSEVQRGEDVDVVFTAFPERKYVGNAVAVGAVIDPVTRTVKVRVSMKNPKGELLPGMFASVDFGDPRDGVVIIPVSAVVTVEGKDYVFVETAPGIFQRRALMLAHSDDTQAIVAKGLTGGEVIVTRGAMLLKGLSFGY